MIGELIKAVALLIIAAVFIVVLRTYKPDFAFLLILGTVAVVVIALMPNALSSISQLRNLFYKSGNTGVYFSTALKALGIAYISGFASDTCRDAGLLSLGNAAETVGKIMIFILSVPLAAAILEAALKFVDL